MFSFCWCFFAPGKGAKNGLFWADWIFFGRWHMQEAAQKKKRRSSTQNMTKISKISSSLLASDTAKGPCNITDFTYVLEEVLPFRFHGSALSFGDNASLRNAPSTGVVTSFLLLFIFFFLSSFLFSISIWTSICFILCFSWWYYVVFSVAVATRSAYQMYLVCTLTSFFISSEV